jgi:hypothetical protein
MDCDYICWVSVRSSKECLFGLRIHRTVCRFTASHAERCNECCIMFAFRYIPQSWWPLLETSQLPLCRNCKRWYTQHQCRYVVLVYTKRELLRQLTPRSSRSVGGWINHSQNNSRSCPPELWFQKSKCKKRFEVQLTRFLRPLAGWGSGCIDPHFLDLGASWRWVVSFTPQPLYPWGKSPRYPLDRLDGPQSRSGRCGDEKHLLPFPWSAVRDPGARYKNWGCPCETGMYGQPTRRPVRIVRILRLWYSGMWGHVGLHRSTDV